ncbi:TetR/AcrR family transcriptional regulator [Tistrella mobilis]|uniref:Transcriptional regulator, TetR family protein n=1 Tax=Tistrella mobilis (strain KA081020-065) TaxID=1110502 RepID=I3TW53_TISMK|nr:TetR/AcrR family transcriptional regulator [Tistrella mobilis]AFK56991.1 transcriptional regulator, TetR family protein [Tistrella mobilis KA081020-065]
MPDPAGPAPAPARQSLPRKAQIREENTVAILAAAEEVFAEMGFRGASTAAIAERAGVPKANLHYYFRTKNQLYARVLESIITEWFEAADRFGISDDPVEAIDHYVRAKMELSRTRPAASKVFANEIIHGAPQLMVYLRTTLRNWAATRAADIERWVAQGRIDPVDPYHLLFMIWAVTQHYADFSCQIQAVLDRDRLPRAEFDRAAEQITRIIVKGIGALERREAAEADASKGTAA